MKNRLKTARFFKNKTQMKLWQETGIHFSTISRIECGYIAPTSYQKDLLSQALGFKKEWLFPENANQGFPKSYLKGKQDVT